MTPTKTITRTDLARRLADGAPLVLLEALPESYFLKGHMPTARNLPHDRVRQLAPTLLPRKDVAIVVYCASATCRNSAVAATALAVTVFVSFAVSSASLAIRSAMRSVLAAITFARCCDCTAVACGSVLPERWGKIDMRIIPAFAQGLGSLMAKRKSFFASVNAAVIPHGEMCYPFDSRGYSRS